ncbi:MAG: UDP-N-acetylmuramate dehydrogenase [Cryomorphaceae bacterium]|nr:UDP-N-acetylmuramate dehydrogenase [Cryomorphaceae bacterium]
MIRRKNFSLKSLNTFGLDVQTREYVRIHSTEDLQNLPADLPKPWFFLGGGSNILFTRDFPGTVLHIDLRGRGIASENEHEAVVFGMAGENWHEFVSYTLQLNLGGIENLSLIPGNVGTAPVQNIGAYGVELRDVFDHLEAYDLDTGKMVSLTLEDCDFAYRNSIFKRTGKNRYIITKVFLRLQKHPQIKTHYGAIAQELETMQISNPDIHDVARAVIRIRKSKLPDPADLGNCGSFFKNPVIDTHHLEKLKKDYPDIPNFPTNTANKTKVPAGWLIEQSGWKGKAIGSVSMHNRQALVLVNLGKATGKELLAHAARVKESVVEKFGIHLEEEVNVL